MFKNQLPHRRQAHLDSDFDLDQFMLFLTDCSIFLATASGYLLLANAVTTLNTASFDLASQLLVAWYILNFVQGVLTRNLIQNHVEPLDKEVRKLTPSHVLDNLNKYLSFFKDKSGK